jgi:N-acetylmuramoyl-L-alanine amidase
MSVSHNWAVLKIAGLIFASALMFFLAGCATPSNESEEGLPYGWTPSTNNIAVPGATPPHATNLIPPATAVTNPPPTHPVPPVKPAPILTWTSLNRWAAISQLTPPRKLSNSPLMTYSVTSKRGTLVLAIGSREATWNNVEIHLGYAPELVDNQVYIHGVDLQKSVEPLLLGCALPAYGANRVIVIDPGHGGIKGGTISVLDKRAEKEFTLDLARRLKPLLETNGWQVFLTRTEDVDVALSNRVNFAEAHHADLFLSLHFNSSAPDKRQSGLETYCMTPMGAPSTLTRGYADNLGEHFSNNAFDEANFLYALRLHTFLLCNVGMEDRGVRRARFMDVLQGQHRPAVLIEGGYLSNPAEAGHIENADYRQRMEAAIANALK